MVSYEENYLEKRPQRLCKMCGKCCRMATNAFTFQKINSLSENNESAKEFLEIFEPYKSIEDARKVDEKTVDNVINLLKLDNNFDKKNTTFYHCRYLQPDNLCSKYKSRPTLCNHFPSTPWAIVPPGCGFEGWLFWKREEIKHKVRIEKEELIELKLLKKRTQDENTLKKIELVEQKICRNINLYKKYGSENW